MKGGELFPVGVPRTRRDLLRQIGGLALFSSGSFSHRNNSPAAGVLTSKLQEFVRARQIAGVVALVSRSGRVVYEEAIGSQDLENGEAMRTGTIFDLRSMTKVFTAVAVMCLVEDGKLQ